MIVFHLRTRHQVVTTFDYQLVTQRMLRVTSNNSNAKAYDADNIGDQTNGALGDNISTDKPQGANGLNFRKFGSTFIKIRLISNKC